MLYQQLGRPDLTPERRAALHVELPNYPSPPALKLADKDLSSESPRVREAAIHSIVGLVPTGQRTLLLSQPNGPAGLPAPAYLQINPAPVANPRARHRFSRL